MQHVEQTPNDHRISDISDLHLIKSQQPDGFDHFLRHRCQRILNTVLARFVHTCVDFLHEGMKVNAARGNVLQTVDEHIHQHGFSTPNTAPQVQPFGRRRYFAKQTTLYRGCKCCADPFEMRQHGLLRIVAGQLSGVDAGVIKRDQIRHKSEPYR